MGAGNSISDLSVGYSHTPDLGLQKMKGVHPRWDIKYSIDQIMYIVHISYSQRCRHEWLRGGLFSAAGIHHFGLNTIKTITILVVIWGPKVLKNTGGGEVGRLNRLST